MKLFQRIRNRMLEENRFTRYFLYAIGEIILVVLGILIALGVAEWNSQRKTDETEQRLLSQLDKGIRADMELLQAGLENANQAIAKLQVLDSLLMQPLSLDRELGHLFGQVYGLRAVRLNRALYEDLKATGLLVVKDEELRSLIIKVYEDDYSKVEWLQTGEWSMNDVNRPYYLKNFTSLRFSEYAKPIDVVKIWQDPYFKNLVYYRLITLQTNQKVIYASTLTDLKNLLAMVEANLNTNLRSK